ncbi:MG2 domain-containing protein [uncultured Castellaniella sp.]|uniref:alpha-2-macroglobulin family protein n=1 Tax=uncultured Castellaniella sp. TaxID=647907 RepID=UPI00262FA71A|nr:MG2 domain-containing protein [uncultured Castellaniella sp.]
MHPILSRTLLAGLALGWAVSASAAQVTRFTPQGAMARIMQAQADFDAPAVALGDDGAADPYRILCDSDAAKGSGRWVDPQHWVYSFEKPLAGAVSCQADPNPDFRDLQGRPLDSGKTYAFSTGGPRAQLSYPWGDRIAEDQVFVLRFNTATDPQSILDHARCEVQGLGESVPVRIVGGDQRDQILRAIGWDRNSAQRLDDARLLQCKRLLPPSAQVRLVVGPGVKSADLPGQPGMVGRAVLAQDFKVRDPFRATMNCTRVNAQAPCSPLFPISLTFSSPVPRALASQVRLETPDGPRQVQADADGAASDALSSLTFGAPFPERATLRLVLPKDLRDDAGRPLANAARFPLDVSVDALPPLVKFASGPFGIVERFADGTPAQELPAVVPLALRRVGPQLRTRDMMISAGRVDDHVTTDDVQALQWMAKVQRLQDGQMTAGQFADVLASRPARDAKRDEPLIDVRSRSVFGPQDAARALTLPGLRDAEGKDIEMIGVPVAAPGLHVLEAASPRLGARLLAEKGKPGGVMYVRSAVLVTNLAVHVKTGRDDALVWVTTLDGGQPVSGAQVAILGCDGTRIRQGETDDRGLWHSQGAVPTDAYCDGTGQSGVFVTARIAADHPAAHGQADFSFAWSSWDQGIEPWRFDVPVSRSAAPDQVAHAVLDRTLLRAGETVSMKLFLRDLTRDGVRNPPTDCLAADKPDCLPGTVDIVHEGSGDVVKLPLKWRLSPSGGLYALLDYAIPRTARLGQYAIQLEAVADRDEGWTPTLYAGSFRVEAFKLPLLTGSLKIAAQAAPAGAAPGGDAPAAAGPLVAPAAVQADLQLAWQSGGPARDLDASLSAVAQPLVPGFDAYSDFNFGVPDSLRDKADQASSDTLRRLILDKRPVRLDAQGAARIELKDLPAVRDPQSWLFEASFADPNGEIQTISQTAQVWPSAVVAGLQTGRWMARQETSTVKLLAVDPQGRPQAGVPMQLDGRVRTTYSTRKRLVGGFYAYDTHDQVASLGTLCQGETDAKGLLECPVSLDREGEIQLFAQARDAQGRVSRAATSIWVWGGENWFAGGDDDRIDVIPSQASYKPGETAEFTVRMPFRRAEALVAVEREGVLETHVVSLDGDQPVVRLPVKAEWGPNVYVSVLAVRGRIRHVPWSSFFDWGWRHPLDWARARSAQVDDAPAPTGLVDLAKPSFRFGLAQIRVSGDADRLKVQVKADHDTYQVRDTAQVEIQAFLPDGKPAAGAGVAFAAVDAALLELMDNGSWDLLDAMRVERDEGVSTATSQGQVVGRRHYGRKAVPAGGGGGFGATRELFDTLLLWRGDLTLDEQGRARVRVPLNDSLTRFRLVAVVDHGQGSFGAGSTDIISTQDLQVISGLPQVVREGDRYQARVTVRNRTQTALPLTVSAQAQGAGGAGQSLPAQDLDLAAGSSATLQWPVEAPLLGSDQGSETLQWTFAAQTRQGSERAADRIEVRQTLQAAVPVTVRQATLLQIRQGAPQRLPVDASAQALKDARGGLRGGVTVQLQSSLAGTLPGVHDWLAAYPYTCMEQLSSKAVGMRDAAAWKALMQRLPDYQDEAGLLTYFPGGRGSVILTAQLIEVSARAQALGWADALPVPARERMLSALQDFVLGRLDETAWAPAQDLFWRKLIAVDALALAGAWQPGMLDSFALDVSDWPTPAVVTWLSILQHVPGLPDRAALLAQTDAVLRARLSRHGTSLVLSDATADQGWWLMSNVATAQARLLMTVLPRPEWRADLSRLMTGLLSLQSGGAWSTTTANVLGVLAVNDYARQEEKQAGQGSVSVTLAPAPARTLAWADMPRADGIHRQALELPWPPSRQGTVDLAQQGAGSGWATVTARAAVPQTRAVDAGMRVERTVTAVSRARPDRWSVGDVYRVSLRIHSREPVVWSVISDPVPAGASILGGGLGRDSAIAVQGESGDQPFWDRPTFIERDAGMYRAYFEVLDAGVQTLEYTVRLNTPGDYQLPPTRIEALYQPDVFGSLPNDPVRVAAD